MKVAIVCDWLVVYAGAERVLEQFIKIYPNADLFCVVDFLKEDERKFLLGKATTKSIIQKFPLAKKKYRSYLPFMPLAIEQLDVSKYDLVISSSHAVAKGVITGPDQLHISYVHSPIRYAWDLQHQYLEEANMKSGFKSWLARLILHYIRLWDYRTANGVDYFIANSKFIANRIKKVYHRESIVIYPPVNVNSYKLFEEKEEYYVTVSRLVPYKKVKLIVEAFNKMPEKTLIVIGDGPEFKMIKKCASSNIQLLGHQTCDVLQSYMQHAKAFVFAAKEDFGIVPIEAQACGTPVIAFGEGGLRETIIPLIEENQMNATGVFFDEQTTEKIIMAVHYFEENAHKILPLNCRINAERFQESLFRSRIEQYIGVLCKNRKEENNKIDN